MSARLTNLIYFPLVLLYCVCKMQVLVSAFYLVYFLLSWCLVFCTMLLLFDDENPLIELTDDDEEDAKNLVRYEFLVHLLKRL